MKTHALNLADELPCPVPKGIENWSENYAFYAYDFELRTGFMAFAGRWIKNPHLWREQLYIYLPDGTMLSHRIIGPSADPSVLSGGVMRLNCESPGERWRLNFDGAMRHDDFDTSRNEPILESRPHSVRLQAVFESNTPVSMTAPTDNTSYGKFHYEQGHMCRATLDFQGVRMDFSGPGYRDHSRGPRQLGSFDGHIWLQLFFPDGKTFASYQVWSKQAERSTQVLNESIIIDSGEIRAASLLEAPRLSSLDRLRDPVVLRISWQDQEQDLSGRPLNNLLNSFTEDFDFYFGVAPQLAEFMSIDQPVSFESAIGEVKGYVQRSMRISPSKRR
jgi:hypothetical protein